MLTAWSCIHNAKKVIGSANHRIRFRLYQNCHCSVISRNDGWRHQSRLSSSAISKPLLYMQAMQSKLDSTAVCSGSHSFCTSVQEPQEKKHKRIKIGPGLEYFIANSGNPSSDKIYTKRELEKLSHPYVQVKDIQGHGRKVYFEVYGCQMNVSDTEVVWSILKEHDYVKTGNVAEADVILIMTCSIREGAEQKIWNKLKHLRALKRRSESKRTFPLKIGILGCMAERLQKKLVEKEKSIDVVVGPDSYRDLPRLLSLVTEDDSAVNVLLSLEETYADVVPVSLSRSRMSAFVSIMRGCDNMCTYCIVPFTRGRERSRDIDSIVEEVRYLSDQGVREVTLLGQNVNSYRDTSSISHYVVPQTNNKVTETARGFKTIYKPKKGGLRFSDLLEKVSDVDPEMRIRFTSPHPKDFPDEVLFAIRDRNNVCNNLHLPAQSGNNRILDLMRRGYTREAYCDLVSHIRSIIPQVSLSSDFISGFCSENEAEFEDTLSLIEQVQYNFCYLFPYSLREKTPAHRKFVDDVPRSVKIDRLERMTEAFRRNSSLLNKQQIGHQHLVLVEGKSKRSDLHLAGRNDGNTKVIFPDVEVDYGDNSGARRLNPGDYVSVMVTDATSQVLKGIPMRISSIQGFAQDLQETGTLMSEVA